MYESSPPNRGADRTIPEFKLNFIREEIKCKSVSVPFRLPILPSSMRSSSQSSRASRMKRAPSWLQVIEENKNDKSNLMVVMQKAQDIYGYLPIEVQKEIARGLDVSLEEVYGVSTFYSQFSLTPKGKYNISICLGTACYVKGADKVLDRLVAKLGIQPEECTPDGVFSLTACRCIGACGLAPVLTVNEDVYGRLVPEDVDKILAKYTA